MVWCYTTDPEVEWEFCDVTDCSYCGSLPITQRDYRGFINVTETRHTLNNHFANPEFPGYG
jgi:hypothetical protein